MFEVDVSWEYPETGRITIELEQFVPALPVLSHAGEPKINLGSGPHVQSWEYDKVSITIEHEPSSYSYTKI